MSGSTQNKEVQPGSCTSESVQDLSSLFPAKSGYQLAAENEQATLRRVAAIGEASRLYRGCAGQAILAATKPADRDAVLARAVPAAERAALQQLIDEAGSRGYALSDGANHPGVSGIATAISATAGSSVAVSGGCRHPASMTRPRWP